MDAHVYIPPHSSKHIIIPLPRLAFSIGAGYSTVRHSQLVGHAYDSDLLRQLVLEMEVWKLDWE